MRVTKQNLTVKKQIRREINRYLRRIESVTLSKSNTQYNSEYLEAPSLLDNKLEELILPVIAMMMDKRIATGGLPTRISAGLKLYIHPMTVMFGQDKVFAVHGQELDVPTYTQDRWVYFYVDDEGEFQINIFNPLNNINKDRIPICRIWVEHGATDYDLSLIRDLRPVGVASANLNHALRQIFLNLMQSIPAIVTSQVEINPHTISGNADLMVYVNANSDNVMYANLVPLPEEYVVIPKPISGSKDYLLIAQATIDNTSADDLKIEYVVKEKGDSLGIYDIPIALIKNVLSSSVEITTDMIEIIGFQKEQKDFYLVSHDFEDMAHNILSFRNEVGCHPANSIIYTAPSGSSIIADNVQGAIDELEIDRHVAATVSGAPLTISIQEITFNYDTDNFDLNGNDLIIKADGINATHIDWGLVGDQVNSNDIPDHNGHSVLDTFNHIINRGKTGGIVITLTGGLGVSWTSGEIYDQANSLFISTDAGSGNVTNNSINYLKWVNGTSLTLSTSEPTGDEILVASGTVYDGIINDYREVNLMSETVANTRRGLRALIPNRIISGMSVYEDIDVTNSLDVIMDAGVFWCCGIEQHTPIEIKSRNTAMVRHFHTAGTWDSDTNAEIDTTNYNNPAKVGGQGLEALPANKWVKSYFIYMNGKIGWIYPTAYYNNETNALAAPLPTIPPGLAPVPKLTAIVYQQGDTDFTNTTWLDLRTGIGEETFNSVFKHTQLSNLLWTLSAHTGTINTFAGFNGTGVAIEYTESNYILTDGTRAFTGDVNLGDFSLLAVDTLYEKTNAFQVRNISGAELTIGTAVYVTGEAVNITTVDKCDNTDKDKMPSFGIIQESISNNNNGYVIESGIIKLDTSGFTGNVGDRIYVQSDGTIDTVEPTSGSIQRIGILIKKAAGSAGRISIKIRGRKSILAAANEHPIIRMGNDVGHKKISFHKYDNTEIGYIDENAIMKIISLTDGTYSATIADLKDAVDKKHTLSDDVYDATSWNGNTDGATKNAIRDKIEIMDTAIGLNTAKETNVSTILSTGTITAISYGITSDGGVDDIVLPEADTNNAGLLGADKWDEIVANTAAKHTQNTDLQLDSGVVAVDGSDNITFTQNSVVPFTSENTGATANTLYLKAGKVGIGINDPQYSLSILNNKKIGYYSVVGNYSSIEFYDASGNMKFTNNWIGGAADIIFLPDGCVGIGTSTPLAKLSINGGLHVGGDSDPGDNNLLIDGTIELSTGTSINEFSTDGTLVGNSDDALPTEKAVKIYADLKAPIASPTFTGQVTIPTINLTSGQIAFPATQNASADANTLDDYEEGAWTPAIEFGGASTGQTYVVRSGSYLKIGTLVCIQGYIRLSAKGSSTGFARLVGLPFTNVSVYGPVILSYSNSVTYTGQFTGLIIASDIEVYLQYVTEAGVETNMTEGNFADNSRLYVYAIYRATQ